MSAIIAVTPGEPAGIGPDLCIQHVQRPPAAQDPILVAVADPVLLRDRAAQLGLPLELIPFEPDGPTRTAGQGELYIHAVTMPAPCRPGELDSDNAPYVLETLDRAVALCRAETCDAMVTGPVHKGIINDAGIPFTGHTEYLAGHFDGAHVVMMLVTEGLRVALATTHLPLARVPEAIDKPLLRRTLTILHEDLQTRFGIPRPRILVSGLNPHAGEDGHLGREEIDIIGPVVRELREQGLDLEGPLPADTLFTDKVLAGGDAVLAMYHDQGLPVLKYKGFGRAVNITLGLPIIRTSVDHGTALDLAGTGRADSTSLGEAIEYAARMAEHRRKSNP